MISEKVALVIGASQGIGKAIAVTLAEKGYCLLLNARREDKLEEVLEQIKHINGLQQNMYFVGDIGNEKRREEVFNTINTKYGKLDVLVNNVPGGEPDSFLSCTNEKIVRDFSQKAITYLDCMKKSYPLMLKNQFGRIINLVGNLWKEPGTNMFTNSLINASIINASKNISNQVASDGITINCVNPGFIKTDRYYQYIERMMEVKNLTKEEAEKRVAQNIPKNRVGTVQEVSSLVGYLVSEEASYITGQQISVDGGALKSV